MVLFQFFLFFFAFFRSAISYESTSEDEYFLRKDDKNKIFERNETTPLEILKPEDIQWLLLIKVSHENHSLFCNGIYVGNKRVLSSTRCFGTRENMVDASQVSIVSPAYLDTTIGSLDIHETTPILFEPRNIAVLRLTQEVDLPPANLRKKQFSWPRVTGLDCSIVVRSHDQVYKIPVLAARSYALCYCIEWATDHWSVCAMPKLVIKDYSNSWSGSPLICNDEIVAILNHPFDPFSCQKNNSVEFDPLTSDSSYLVLTDVTKKTDWFIDQVFGRKHQFWT